MTHALSDVVLGLQIRTLGGFQVSLDGQPIPESAWKRDKGLQLFQYFLISNGTSIHKEEIIASLWPDLNADAGERDFKVALNALNQALEPTRTARDSFRFIKRSGSTYALLMQEVHLDLHQFEAIIAEGNRMLKSDAENAILKFRAAAQLYKGIFLPERRYDEWTSDIRERLHTLALTTMTQLADLIVEENPHEALQYVQRVIAYEKVWEDAYRVAMKAYLSLGNRPMALRMYERCADVLADAYDVEPLPQTQALYIRIKQI